MFRRINFFFFLIILMVSVILFLKCQTSKTAEVAGEELKFLNLSDTVRYVGIDVCKKCHGDIYESFIQTGMGKSFALATRQKSAAGFSGGEKIFDKYSNLWYQPYWDGDSMKVKEYRLSGKDTVHKRTESIRYIVGSGQHTNSHIVEENGYLYQAPFTYYVQKRKLDLPPGFEHGYNSRFSRSLGTECITCHNAYPDFVKGSFNKYKKIPEGINCERCHGPGSLHVQWKEAGRIIDVQKDTDFSIVNPRKLPSDYQTDICQRCHLQGNVILKTGKTFFDFKPGMRLSKVMDIYMPEYENDEHGFIMASHAQRIKKSRCFLQSMNGGKPELTCITCHNPHISVRQTSENYFVEKCNSCHGKKSCSEKKSARDKVNNNCIKCHMPRSGSVDIPHVTITDHYIRKRPDKNKNNSQNSGKFRMLACINNPKPDAESKANAFLYFYEKFDHKSFHLDSAKKFLDGLNPKKNIRTFIHFYFLKQDYNSIVALAEKIKGIHKDAMTNYRIGEAYLALNDDTKALQFFIIAKNQEPFNFDFRNKLGLTYQMRPNTNKAQEHFKFIIKENTKNTAALNNMAFSYLVGWDAAGNNRWYMIDSAERFINRALATNPDYTPALLNKVKITMIRGNKEKALADAIALSRMYPADKDIKQFLDFLRKY